MTKQAKSSAPSSIAAGPSQWSEQSKQSVAFYFNSDYVDDPYRRGIAAASEALGDEAAQHGLVLAHDGADVKRELEVVVIVPHDHISVARVQGRARESM